MDALDVELDTRDAGFLGAAFFDELEPLVVDSAGIQVCRGKPGAAAKVVISGEAGLGQDSMHGPTTPAAIWREGVIDQGLRTVNTAGHRRLGLPRRNVANGWLRGGHGEWES